MGRLEWPNLSFCAGLPGRRAARGNWARSAVIRLAWRRVARPRHPAKKSKKAKALRCVPVMLAVRLIIGLIVTAWRFNGRPGGSPERGAVVAKVTVPLGGFLINPGFCCN
jgi:hypothetical protein